MGMGDNHGGNWLLAEDGRHFRIDYSYLFGERPSGTRCPIPTTFNHVVQLCRNNWDAFILPCAVRIMKRLLSRRKDLFFFAQGVLISLEMDPDLFNRMVIWVNSLS